MSGNSIRRFSLINSTFLSSPLYGAIFLIRFSFGLALFTLPIYLPRRDFSNLAVGIVVASYPIAETICSPMFGILADRYGRRRLIYVGLAISAVTLFAFTLSRNIGFLITIHAIEGLAAAMIVVGSLAMVTDISTVSNRGREMGIYDSANLGGYVIGIFMAGILNRTFSMSTSFYFGSILAGIGAILSFKYLKEKSAHVTQSPSSPLQTMRVLLTNRRSAAIFPIWLAVTIFIGMALTFSPRLGPSLLMSSFLLAGAVLLLAFTQPFFGRLSDKYGRNRLMTLGMLSLLGLIVSAITVIREPTHFLLIAPFLAVFGLGSFAFAPAALAWLGDLAPSEGRGTTMGVYSLVISLGTIIGPLLGGYLLDRFGFSSLFYAALVILLAALALAVVLAGPDLKDLSHNSHR
ncbi:MAG TPA: MFS transporter [Terriglobales bacterium]|nr:MFS transporter [Terriglobales bacterium]